MSSHSSIFVWAFPSSIRHPYGAASCPARAWCGCPTKGADMSSVTTTSFFTLTGCAGLTFNGQADRYRKNIAAIQLLRRLQAAGRQPTDLTDAERLTLA